jgi:hypothetical protein
MSEYAEKHNVSRLIGAPPGYVGYEEGGQLTERIRRRPYSVVLLDEIEKAHPEIFNTLLQVMEEGRLTDAFGRKVDFRNVVMIMTTNAGAEAIKNESGFGFQKPDQDASYDSMKTRVQEHIEKVFRPEFLNRLDDVIVFRHLTNEDLKSVIELELAHVRKRLADRGLFAGIDRWRERVPDQDGLQGPRFRGSAPASRDRGPRRRSALRRVASRVVPGQQSDCHRRDPRRRRQDPATGFPRRNPRRGGSAARRGRGRRLTVSRAAQSLALGHTSANAKLTCGLFLWPMAFLVSSAGTASWMASWMASIRTGSSRPFTR